MYRAVPFPAGKAILELPSKLAPVWRSPNYPPPSLIMASTLAAYSIHSPTPGEPSQRNARLTGAYLTTQHKTSLFVSAQGSKTPEEATSEAQLGATQMDFLASKPPRLTNLFCPCHDAPTGIPSIGMFSPILRLLVPRSTPLSP